MKQSLTLTLKQENHISFVFNGRTYSYNGDVELLPESTVNGVMGQRVFAHKRWAHGGKGLTGWVRGALSIGTGGGYRSTVYLVEKDDDRKIYQCVHIKNIE